MTDPVHAAGAPSGDLPTDGLSPEEFLLARDAGFTPAGFVLGSAVRHLGQPMSRPENTELTDLTLAVDSAARSAMTRLEDDARRLGADGIIGIQPRITWDAWKERTLEFMVTGTAVRQSGRDTVGSRAPGGRPFTCGLSGQDLWTLLRSGYRPAGLVTGCCVYFAAVEYAKGNRELADLTRGLYRARELAMGRMQAAASKLAAAGVVGVRFEDIGFLDAGSRADPGMVEFCVVGTAIVPVTGAPGMTSPRVAMAVDLPGSSRPPGGRGHRLLAVVVSDVAHHLAGQRGVVDHGRAGDLTRHHDQPGGKQRLAGDPGGGVARERGVHHGIRDLSPEQVSSARTVAAPATIARSLRRATAGAKCHHNLFIRLQVFLTSIG